MHLSDRYRMSNTLEIVAQFNTNGVGPIVFTQKYCCVRGKNC